MKALSWLVVIVISCSVNASWSVEYDRFHSPSEISTFVDELVATHPTIASVHSVGTSLEGRDMRVVKISDNVGIDETDEGDVVFFATQHAREWMATEMALYLIEHLLSEYATNPEIKADVDAVQIWVMPVANPDGYEFSHTGDTERCWRKNMRPNADGTFGVDLNRNWSFQFGGVGSSSEMGDLRYRGPIAFSEPESRVKRDFLNGLANLKALFNYHSFSELYLRPWSYTTSDPPGEETLKAVSNRSLERVESVHGHDYGDFLGQNSGVLTDWVWDEHRSAVYTPELRPDSAVCRKATPPVDCNCRGFNPPDSEILPSNEENLQAALALIHDAAGREVWLRDHPDDDGTEPSATWTGDGWSQPFWVSPDIDTVPEELDQGATVDLRISIKNETGRVARDVRVDAYFTDPRISLEFPNSDAQLIGSQTVNVPPSGTTVTMPWTVPIGTNSWGERHWCVGAIIMHDTDMPLTTEAQRSSNVAIKNFTTTESIAAGNFVVAGTNFLATDAELIVKVDDGSIPDGWSVTVPPVTGNQETGRLMRKAALLGANGRLLGPSETMYIPIRVEPPAGALSGTTVDLHVHAGLKPLIAGERPIFGNGFTYRIVVP